MRMSTFRSSGGTGPARCEHAVDSGRWDLLPERHCGAGTERSPLPGLEEERRPESAIPADRGVYLRLSVTDRCNLRCRYCRPERGCSALPPEQAAAGEEVVELVGLIDRELGIRKLRITGGEPLVRPGLVGLVEGLRARLPAARLCLTTNGLLLRSHAASLKAAGIEFVNVSLDAADAATFDSITRGGRLADALDGIRAAREAGFDAVKINSVLLETANGRRIEHLVRLAAEEGCEIRFIELMPCGEGADLFAADYLSADEAFRRLLVAFEHIGVEPWSATARRHRLRVDGREVVVGFIAAVSHPFCEGCDRLRLDVGGTLVSCLRGEDGIDLLKPLRASDPELVRREVRRCFAGKCPPGDAWPRRRMVAIGG